MHNVRDVRDLWRYVCDESVELAPARLYGMGQWGYSQSADQYSIASRAVVCHIYDSR